MAALGPKAVPGLLPILEHGPFWAQVRAVRAVEALARAHPGAADPAISPLLDLIYMDQSDYLSVYVLGLLTGYDGPEMARWRRHVHEARAAFVRSLYEDRDRWLSALTVEETPPSQKSPAPPTGAGGAEKAQAETRPGPRPAQGAAAEEKEAVVGRETWREGARSDGL